MKLAKRYSSKALEVLLALCLMLCLPPGFAIEIDGLYQATISVESRNSEQERRRAFGAAMREVLAKVSGFRTTTNSASIRRALNNPEPYVESWRTQASLMPVDPDAEVSELQELIEIEINFYESEIQRLLDENNMPIWPVNRPETLVWLVVQDELDERQMLSSDSREEANRIAVIQDSANMRGLPLLFPLLDLEDQLRLNVNKLWELDEAAILNASQRYQAESILALRIYRSLSGEVLAKSLYFFRDNVFSYEEFELNEEDFISGSVNLATNELSQYYAVLISGTENSVRINLQVDGVDSPEDYAALLSYLNALEGVSSFQLTRVVSSSLSLQLETGGQLRQLVETIALEPTLQEVTELSRAGDDVSMHYRWIKN
ncbi:MAG: DUF2066 domain-containing protein [Gammaproteobacteria bacterium]|nr:DUF2066 domain-containing protein [Gammaproteobacteria bacterium]